MNASEATGLYKTELIPNISDELFVFFSIIFIPIITVPGVFFNVINVIVFTKMGLANTTNISLVSMAVSDIGSQLTMIGFSITSSPLTAAVVLSSETLTAIDYDFIGTPHNMFSRISGLLTGLISLERLLCVAWPLHVRTMVTRRRTSLAVVVIYVLMFTNTIPTYIGHPLGMKFDPELNITVFGVIFGAETKELESISITISVAVQISSFLVVTASTLFLAQSLHTASQWQGSVTSQASKSIRREKKLIKMVVLISTVFIVSSLPSVLTLALLCFRPDLRLSEGRDDLIKTIWIACFEMHSVSTTVNIFIYLAVSSRFKTYFFSMFGFLSTQKEMQSKSK